MHACRIALSFIRVDENLFNNLQIWMQFFKALICSKSRHIVTLNKTCISVRSAVNYCAFWEDSHLGRANICGES